MKKLYLLILFSFLTFASVEASSFGPGKKGATDRSVGAHAQTELGDLLLHDNRLDKLILGNPLREVYGLFAANRIQKVLIYDARRSYQKIEVLNRERTEVLFSIDPDCSPNDSACVIRRINVKSSTFHTPGNLRVGKYYVDIMHSPNKVSRVMWYEGNLIVRVNQSALSYVLQTSTIPKPWYETMDRETVPDSTRIIGIMITGKNLDGVSYQTADSIQKKHLALAGLAKKGRVRKKGAVIARPQAQNSDVVLASSVQGTGKSETGNAVTRSPVSDSTAKAKPVLVPASSPASSNEEKKTEVKSDQGLILESSPEKVRASEDTRPKADVSDLK